MQIFVKRNGVEEGPFTKDQLQALLTEGKMRPIELAYHDGLSNWMPLAAVLAPRAQPPPFKGVPRSIEDATNANAPANPSVATGNAPKLQHPEPGSGQTDFMEQREDIAGKLSATMRRLQEVDWHAAFPWRRMLSDKPWDFVWVRKLLIFCVLPAAAAVLLDGYGGSAELLKLCVAGYVALLWAFGLSWITKPQSNSFAEASKTILPPFVLQTGVLILAGKVEWLSKAFATTANGNLVWRVISLLSIWTIWQSTIAVCFLANHRRAPESRRSLLYLGSITGMIACVSPVLARFLDHAWFDYNRWLFLGAFQSQPLASLIATMAMGTFVGGMLASVILVATTNRQHQWHFAISGVVGSAVLMTLNSLTVGTWGNIVLLAMAALGFATYVRTSNDTVPTA